MTELDLSVAGVGGIDRLEATIGGDVTVVTGDNASNKTSLLRALAFAIGHHDVPVRSGVEEARVELTADGRTVARTARRENGALATAGEALIDDADAVERFERFGCLLEFNDLRRAVREDGDYERLLKSPMDLDALEDERSRKVGERADLREDVEALADVEERLAARREELSTARRRTERMERAVEHLRARQAAAASDADGEGADELRARRRELVDRRVEHERRIEDLEEAVERLDERVAELEADLDEAREAAAEHDVADLRAERGSLAEEREELTERIELLQSVLTANREMLSSPHAGVLGRESGVMGDELTCWACGGVAGESEFEETVEDLRELVERERERRREFDPRLADLDERIEAAEEARRRVADLENRLEEVRQRRESRRESLATAREQVAELQEEIRELDREMGERNGDRESAVTDLTEAIETARVDLHTAHREVERLESVVEDLAADREERERKRERVAALDEEIAELTERIRNFEAELRESFNGAMDDLLAALAFEGVERIRLDGEFDLVVAREVDGVTRRDRIEHLSESEREMVGLVLGLAGYLAYDVAEVAPVLLLDALGAFDAERTVRLLEYFAGETGTVVAALLPDSADAVAAAELNGASVAVLDRSDGETG